MSATVWVRDLSRLSKWLATPPQILELRKLQHVTFMLVLARGLVLLLRSLRRRLRVDATAEADRTSRSVVVQVSELEQSDAKCSIPYLGLTSREILSRAKEHTAPRTHPPITDGRLDSLKELQEKLRSLYEIQGIEGEAGECFRREVLSMAAHLLHGSTANVSGVLSKHSRESMYIAVLTYTMLARDRNVHSPEILASDMPSPALKEACEHFGIKLVEVESMGSMGLLTVEATEEQITHSTIAIFARCPCTQLGTFDPIMELGNIARKHSVGLHCDATPSGFLLCGLKAAQIYKGKFDFDVAGVTSVSVESKHVKNISVFLSKDMPVYAPPNTCMQHTMGELGMLAVSALMLLVTVGFYSCRLGHHAPSGLRWVHFFCGVPSQPQVEV